MCSLPQDPTEILVEAEAFDDYGGWVMDSQFDLEMGSPYLLAHGNGVPVADATTVIDTLPGLYHIWVRAKDWVPGHHPGRFTLMVNEKTLEPQFGANDQDWSWEYGAAVALGSKTKLALHDLTGFCGRCDAIFLSRTGEPPRSDAARSWRRTLRGLPQAPTNMGNFDVIVVGGGIVGSAAALVAARLGNRVALIHNRPVLGGNGSVEIGLRPRGVTGPLIDEISQRHSNGDLNAESLLRAESNATVLLEHTVYDTITRDSTIISLDARDARTGREIRLSATSFIDCSGKCILVKSEYGESLAPLEGDDYIHHGHTLFFRTSMANSATPFPDVPWAREISKDYSNLGGQLVRPGIENGPGPATPLMGELDPSASLRQRMKLPLTHFWEYGQRLDPYTTGEHVRDYLLRAIYGTFWNVKQELQYANLKLEWVAFVAAQGEFRRYEGDYVLSEVDIRTHKQFLDGVVQNDGAFCLHYPAEEDAKYDFRLKHWEWDERDKKPYDIPFRCLYSKNISNLMMAGKHISVTHVAGSNTKFMGNGGQHAIATAAAAHLCEKYDTTPRGMINHISELKVLCSRFTGLVNTDPINDQSTSMAKL
ncbi:FAD dependent oxidoreductase-domain-containing protein [Mariannaea sp. PMI_226]|nr:FAD dependent oxidoreductase-domain-containing protein [Mariannaea sp. PMI_226]